MCKSFRILMEGNFPLMQAIKMPFSSETVPSKQTVQDLCTFANSPHKSTKPDAEMGMKATTKGTF